MNDCHAGLSNHPAHRTRLIVSLAPPADAGYLSHLACLLTTLISKPQKNGLGLSSTSTFNLRTLAGAFARASASVRFAPLVSLRYARARAPFLCVLTDALAWLGKLRHAGHSVGLRL